LRCLAWYPMHMTRVQYICFWRRWKPVTLPHWQEDSKTDMTLGRTSVPWRQRQFAWQETKKLFNVYGIGQFTATTRPIPLSDPDPYATRASAPGSITLS